MTSNSVVSRCVYDGSSFNRTSILYDEQYYEQRFQHPLLIHRTHMYGNIGTTNPYRKFSVNIISILTHLSPSKILPVNSPRTAVKSSNAFELRHDLLLDGSIVNVSRSINFTAIVKVEVRDNKNLAADSPLRSSTVYRASTYSSHRTAYSCV